MARLKQGNLFDEAQELSKLRELERLLEQAQLEYTQLPEKIEKERKEHESTIPPMMEIAERQQFNRFEQTLSRGQVENILRTQRKSFVMMILLLVTTILLAIWAWGISGLQLPG